jgi:hypothetical protein
MKTGGAPENAVRDSASLKRSVSFGMASEEAIALWTPLRGAAVFGTVSSSMPDVLR